MRHFNRRGIPFGNDFQVNTYTTDDQLAPAVAIGADGDFVVAWESIGSSGSDDGSLFGRSIQMRHFNRRATPLGDDFQANSYITGDQRRPSVAVDANGDFLVTWDSLGSRGADTADEDGNSIQIRRFNRNVMPLGNDFQANSYITGNQVDPAIGVGADGDIVVVWKSQGSAGTDNCGQGSCGLSVQARLFGPEADLAITNDNGLSSLSPGLSITYILTVSNAGPDDVYGSIVRDLFPAELVGVSWTCRPSPGSECTAGPVAGDIIDTVDLLAGGTLTYTANATVADGATGSVSNTATVTRPAGDPNPDNNSAMDDDPLVPEPAETTSRPSL
ncbi:MAG: DUF11 domain-containing protein [bacterium]|nr:DUF11 domain-containing protein [bacterium]